MHPDRKLLPRLFPFAGVITSTLALKSVPKLLSVLLACITAFVLSSCSMNEPDSEAIFDSIFVVAGAENVRRVKTDWNTHEVSYEVAAEYPAEHILAELKSGLESKGWKLVEYDPLKPASGKTSPEWMDVSDEDKTSSHRAYLWSSIWVNKGGDNLMHVLRFESSDGNEPLNRMKAVASFLGQLRIGEADTKRAEMQQ